MLALLGVRQREVAQVAGAGRRRRGAVGVERCRDRRSESFKAALICCGRLPCGRIRTRLLPLPMLLRALEPEALQRRAPSSGVGRAAMRSARASGAAQLDGQLVGSSRGARVAAGAPGRAIPRPAPGRAHGVGRRGVVPRSCRARAGRTRPGAPRPARGRGPASSPVRARGGAPRARRVAGRRRPPRPARRGSGPRRRGAAAPVQHREAGRQARLQREGAQQRRRRRGWSDRGQVHLACRAPQRAALRVRAASLARGGALELLADAVAQLGGGGLGEGDGGEPLHRAGTRPPPARRCARPARWSSRSRSASTKKVRSSSGAAARAAWSAGTRLSRFRLRRAAVQCQQPVLGRLCARLRSYSSSRAAGQALEIAAAAIAKTAAVGRDRAPAGTGPGGCPPRWSRAPAPAAALWQARTALSRA